MAKQVYFFLLFCGAFLATNAFAVKSFSDAPNLSAAYAADYADQLRIKGSLSEPTILRSDYDPIEIYQTSTSIQLVYLDNLTNISITVYNKTGNLVYSNTVNPVYGGQLIISTSGWAKGNYTINVCNTTNNCISADFSL